MALSAALDVPVHSSRLLDEGPRRAVLHTNRAAAYLARGAAGPLREGESDSTGLLEGLDHGETDALRRHWEAAVMDTERSVGPPRHLAGWEASIRNEASQL